MLLSLVWSKYYLNWKLEIRKFLSDISNEKQTVDENGGELIFLSVQRRFVWSDAIFLLNMMSRSKSKFWLFDSGIRIFNNLKKHNKIYEYSSILCAEENRLCYNILGTWKNNRESYINRYYWENSRRVIIWTMILNL